MLLRYSFKVFLVLGSCSSYSLASLLMQAWSTNHRNDFAAASFSLSYPISTPLGKQVSPANGMLSVKDSDTSKLTDYTPLYYASSTSTVPYSADGKYVVQTTDKNGVTQFFTLSTYLYKLYNSSLKQYLEDTC